MKLSRTRSTIVSLIGLAAAAATLAGGALLLMRGTAPTGTSARQQPQKSHIIMEGVDINSNGPGHPRPEFRQAKPSGERPLLPPDLQSGERP
jgi:hypothetical protein